MQTEDNWTLAREQYQTLVSIEYFTVAYPDWLLMSTRCSDLMRHQSRALSTTNMLVLVIVGLICTLAASHVPSD